MTNHLADALRAESNGREGAPFAEIAATGEVITLGALWTGAEKMAGALIAMGVAPGDRVAAQTEKSVAAIQLYLGTVLAGGVYLPMNPAYMGAEVDHLLGDADPRVFICDPSRRPAACAARVETLDAAGAGSFMEAARAADPAAPVARDADDLAGLLYTSGTTGKPKGAMTTHHNLASNAATLARLWGFGRQDRLLHALPIFHTHGLFVATNVTLMGGGSLIFFDKFNADAILSAMPRATALMGVPTFYTRLLESDGLAEAARGMRLFVSGSAPLLAETHRAFEAETGQRILERYGMTETNMICSNPYEGERRPGSVGLPLPDVALRIADPETGAALARGEIGSIEVKGPNVFKGYWNMPEKTAQEFRDGWFVTGDVGQQAGDGYVTLVGRAKDLIIVGGFNVYPVEVEEAVDALPGVKESAVIGLPHRDMGEGVAAVVAREAGAAVTEAAILDALKDRLARFKQPRRVIVLDALPRNAMGKVQKAELRKTYAGLFDERN